MSILGKIFKSKLDQRKFEIKEEYWKALEKKLDDQKNKGGSYFGKLIFLSVLLIVFLSTLFWFFYPDKKNENIAEKSIAADFLISKIKKDSLEFNEKNSPAPTGTDNKEKDVKSGYTHSGLSSGKISPAENNPDNNLSENAGNYLYKKKQNAGKKDDGNNSGHNSKNTWLKTATKNSLNQKEEKINPNYNLIINPNNSEGNPTTLAQENEFHLNSPTQKNLINQTNPGSENSNLLASLGAKTPMDLMGKIFPPGFPENQQAELKNSLKENSLKRSQVHYFGDIYSGLMYTGKILKSRNSLMNDYVIRRDNEESFRFSGNMGIDVGINVKRWSLSTGLNYHVQGETTDYKPEFYQWLKTTTSNWNVKDNSYWFADTVNTVSILVAEGSWQPVDTFITYYNASISDTVSTTITINQYVVDTTYNQYFYKVDSNYISDFDSTKITKTDSANQLVNDPTVKLPKTISKMSYFEIPIMAGYEFPLNHATLMLRTGFGLGLLSKINAAYLKNDLSGTEQVKITRMNKTVINYLLRFGVLYHLNERIALNIEPQFRLNLNSVMKDSEFSQKYYNAGINIGVVYRW